MNYHETTSSILLCIIHSLCFCAAIFSKRISPRRWRQCTGELDVYTNGTYTFETHKLFRDYNYKRNDEGVKKVAGEFFGFAFYITRDGLCWGTGRYRNGYSYVIVTWDGEVIELSAKNNESGFSRYSKWLLFTIRRYHKQGKLIMFP